MNVFGMRQHAGARSAVKEAWKGQVEWPSRMELATSYDVADVVVMSFGLHYHADSSKSGFEPAVREAPRQLDAFARASPGRLAVFREVSIQQCVSRGPIVVAAACCAIPLPRALSPSCRLADAGWLARLPAGPRPFELRL